MGGVESRLLGEVLVCSLLSILLVLVYSLLSILLVLVCSLLSIFPLVEVGVLCIEPIDAFTVCLLACHHLPRFSLSCLPLELELLDPDGPPFLPLRLITVQ